MPILPARTLKKYSSLPTDSPSSQTIKPSLGHSVSDPFSGNRIAHAFYGLRKRAEDKSESKNATDLSESFEGDDKVETSRMMSSPKRSVPGSPLDDTERPHLTPYFQKKNNHKELVCSFEQKQKVETKCGDFSTENKRPTLNPFFNVNHHFMKALRKIGSKDNFNRLRTGRDE